MSDDEYADELYVQELEERVDYLERKVYDLIETANVLVESHNRMVNAIVAATPVQTPGN
jgi:hypothetical protein